MVTHFDHVTIVVRALAKAKAFFALLGFLEQQSVVIAGGQFSRYMGIPGIEAEHVTLALCNASPRRYRGRFRRLSANGVQLRNEIMEFHDRKLVFLSGPEGVTVELAQWLRHQ